MDERRRHVFRIDALSKDAIAMRELAAYIADLSELLGNHDSVHCHEIRDGSLEVVFDVEPSSAESVVERMLDARHPAGEPSARSAWWSLNRRLKRDGASGMVMAQNGTVPRTLIEIPGAREEAEERLPILWEAGTVDGIPTGVGGRLLDPEWVSVRIVDSGAVVNCEARPSTAIGIAQHLLTTPVRVAGKGRWVHDQDKGWQRDKFRIEQFDVLDSRPLAEVVGEMREVYARTDWARMDDPVDALRSIRNDE